MNFHKKKISKKPAPEPKPEPIAESTVEPTTEPEISLDPTNTNLRKKVSISIPIVTFFVIIAILGFGIYKVLRTIDFTIFLRVAGDELEQDSFGHTNFLLLGTGDKSHEGSQLTDTIIVASLDYEDKLVSMLSIPRDLYVEDSLVGSSRINEVYFNAEKHFGSSQEGLDYMKRRVEEIVGMPIHYSIKINFQGFKDLVDALGGVDVYVDKPIYDPYYPKDGTFQYETFKIAAGQHHMDGETALKYARSRKTTSDFDRAERQQKIIYAIKEKALQTDTIFSKSKINAILDAMKSNIDTDIKVNEILTLGSYAKDFSKDRITQRLLHDNPVDCGGFLYTPARTLYGGAFVLVPAGSLDFIHYYADLNFHYPLAVKEDPSIHILNGTKTPGVAGETKQILQRYCFTIPHFGNALTKEVTETTYYYQPILDEDGDVTDQKPEALYFLQKLIPGKETTEIPLEYKEYFNQSDIILELGSDYVNSENYIDDPYYSLVNVETYGNTTDNTTTETTSTAPTE